MLTSWIEVEGTNQVAVLCLRSGAVAIHDVLEGNYIPGVSDYRLANVYISMSEYEGLGKPLIESFDIPVLAYTAVAIPETMGGSGVLFCEKNYEALAELVGVLVSEDNLRQHIITRQRERVHTLLEANVRPIWKSLLKGVLAEQEYANSKEILATT